MVSKKRVVVTLVALGAASAAATAAWAILKLREQAYVDEARRRFASESEGTDKAATEQPPEDDEPVIVTRSVRGPSSAEFMLITALSQAGWPRPGMEQKFGTDRTGPFALVPSDFGPIWVRPQGASFTVVGYGDDRSPKPIAAGTFAAGVDFDEVVGYIRRAEETP